MYKAYRVKCCCTLINEGLSKLLIMAEHVCATSCTCNENSAIYNGPERPCEAKAKPAAAEAKASTDRASFS